VASEPLACAPCVRAILDEHRSCGMILGRVCVSVDKPVTLCQAVEFGCRRILTARSQTVTRVGPVYFMSSKGTIVESFGMQLF
jgi:hypothetical protein